ncbi:MAG: hypothetical protein V5A68_01860 [Candidatus Thermoplasmatota archaeon]
MEEMLRKIGSWLFLIGIVVAVIAGLVTGTQTWNPPYYLHVGLAVLGFIVGILSFFAVGTITEEKVPTFLIAALILVGIGAAGSTSWFENVEYIGTYFANIAGMIAVFVAPAAGLLAIRAIWDAGKTEEIENMMPTNRR